MKRAFNFSAGPAALPLEVLEDVASQMTNWRDSGCSVMEMSHRGKAFTQIAQNAEADLRTLLNLPANYRVLFLQGGATQQFSQIPLNLLSGGSADYLVTGAWSRKAFDEASRIAPHLNARVRLAGETQNNIIAADQLTLDPAARYVHLCTNETIHGIEILSDDQLPQTGSVPLIADMSSHILSRPMDISRFALVYAGAQKNIGPAGLTLVIVREDLLGQAAPITPPLLDYACQDKHVSMLNTPPTFALYVAACVLRWLLQQGGLSAIEQQNRHKAELLYRCIDQSDGFYRNEVPPTCRSRMNIPFFIHDNRLETAFLDGADAVGLQQLKGHKSVGGLRASLYNAVPVQAVQALTEYMETFARQHA